LNQVAEFLGGRNSSKLKNQVRKPRKPGSGVRRVGSSGREPDLLSVERAERFSEKHRGDAKAHSPIAFERGACEGDRL
jgi:hypothetical protein